MNTKKKQEQSDSDQVQLYSRSDSCHSMHAMASSSKDDEERKDASSDDSIGPRPCP